VAADLIELDGEEIGKMSPLERQARLERLLAKAHGGIEFTEHLKGRRGHVRRRLQAWARGGRGEATRPAIRIRPVQTLAEGQESEFAEHDAHLGRDVLTVVRSERKGPALWEAGAFPTVTASRPHETVGVPSL